MLRSALHWFGAPAEPEAVHGDVGPIPGFRNPYHNGVSTMLSMAVYPVYVYGSSGGELFVPEMDENAFPRSPGRRRRCVWCAAPPNSPSASALRPSNCATTAGGS